MSLLISIFKTFYPQTHDLVIEKKMGRAVQAPLLFALQYLSVLHLNKTPEAINASAQAKVDLGEL